jgi:hypothetical protein
MANRNSTNPLVVDYNPPESALQATLRLAVDYNPPQSALQAVNALIIDWVPVDPSSQLGTQGLLIEFIPIPDTTPENIIGASLQSTGIIGAFARSRKIE